MQFWIDFWTFFFFVSLAFFAGLVVIVGIGGFFNLRSLFKGLREPHDPQGSDGPSQT